MLTGILKKLFKLSLSGLLVVIALALNGCALLYFPLLLFVPLQPIIMIAAKMGARYGPLLLMMIVQNDPLDQNQEIISLSPPEMVAEMQLENLDQEIMYQLDNCQNLVEMKVVEIDQMDEMWLENQLQRAQNKNCSVKIVFVDSRDYSYGKRLSRPILDKIKNAGIGFETIGKLANKIIKTEKSSMIVEENQKLSFNEINK